MTQDEMKQALERVRLNAHAQFPDNIARLEQLDGHLLTVAMVIDHFFDEQVRMYGGPS